MPRLLVVHHRVEPEAAVLVPGGKVEQPRYVVQALAVPNVGVVVGEGPEDVVEWLLVGGGARPVEVDVVREGAGQVGVDLVLHHRVGDLHVPHGWVEVVNETLNKIEEIKNK